MRFRYADICSITAGVTRNRLSEFQAAKSGVMSERYLEKRILESRMISGLQIPGEYQNTFLVSWKAESVIMDEQYLKK